MAGGGGGVPSPCAQARGGGRRRRHQAASLPLDVIAEIAARSDPATLVRCAATCAELRGRVADPGFRRRLRLRHADGHRFVPSLLRGHLAGGGAGVDKEDRMYLVDAATASLLRAAESFPPGPDGAPLKLHRPVSAREGLVLVHKDHELRVCNLATGRSQAVPHGPGEFINSHIHHVLLVGDGDGDGDVGRPFQVVKASLVFEDNNRRLQVQTFSSELGSWGPCTEIRTPQIHGQVDSQYVYSNHRHYERRRDDPLRTRPLVAGGAVHWLCLTDEAGYVLKLRFRAPAAAAAAAPRLTVTKLPDSCPSNYRSQGRQLLATMAPGGSPAVLVADGKKISAWTRSKHTARWGQQPEVVIEYEAISRLLGDLGDRMMLSWSMGRQQKVSLEWFAERSGIVLIRMYDEYLFWLDLQSMEIVRWSEDVQICRNKTIYQPCEMDLSNWAPTFSSSL